MTFIRACVFLMVLTHSVVFASDLAEATPTSQDSLPQVGSWIFSGVATNESGERFGYFFQMQRQGAAFHAKTALIDGQTNKLLLFYEDNETIDSLSSLNWHVGHAFMRFNPINESWIFGVKMDNKQGFHFKVDTLAKDKDIHDTSELNPGVELQALETTRLNGHIQIGTDNKEQFVTGNKAWFARIRLSKNQKTGQSISTTFCQLNNDNGFYVAKLKSLSQASGVASWHNASGTKLKMSPLISIKSLANNECLLHVGTPKLDMKLYNTLKNDYKFSHAMAGFSNQVPMGFCFVEEQSFQPLA